MDADPAPFEDQTASNRDQTASDRDQTSSDQDQTASDRDQSASDQDQESSNEDQDAADADVAGGADRATYERTTKARAHATGGRSGSRPPARGGPGKSRHGERARPRRDTARRGERRFAMRRRFGAIRRPTVARVGRRSCCAAHVIASGPPPIASGPPKTASGQRQIERSRRGSADEALRLRRESAELLEEAATDQLMATRTRLLGLDEIARELVRTRRRQDAALMLAFVDVDGLKQINDSKGHLAGDALLRLVGRTLIGKTSVPTT